MRSPIDDKPTTPSLRRQAKRAAKRQFPAGRALGRIEFYEQSRGLTPTVQVDGCVTRAGAPTPRTLTRAPKQPRAPKPPVYAAANKARAKLVPGFPATINRPTWRPLGPNLIPHGQTYGSGGNNDPSVSGRCVGLVVDAGDPNHLVLCSAGGGLWESRNLGQAWHPLTDQQPTLSMGAIASAPSSPNIVYAGTGEGDTLSPLGVGLLRSDDGGLSWQLLSSNQLAGHGIYDIQVDPVDPLRVWVATTSQLVESRDGGVSWRVVQPVRTWDVSINPRATGELFAATEAGLIHSTNHGRTWSLVSLPGLIGTPRFRRLEVRHAPSRPSVVYAAGVVDGTGWLWRRATNTGSFSRQKTPNLKSDSDIAQSWYDWCLGVSPRDHNTVYWGAVELYKGRRGGSGFRWSNISSRSSGDSIHPDQHHITFDPSDPNVVYVCNDGGLFRSPDNGVKWESLNPGLDITEFEFIAHLESEDEWLIGGTQDNGTLSYIVNREWKQIALGDGGDCGADESNQLCYHSFWGMWIERAKALRPRAFVWRDVSPPFGRNYEALFYPPMEVRDTIVAKAGTSLFVSEDSGIHWDEVNLGTGGALASALAIVSTTRILVGTNKGDVVRVTRHKSGWQNASVRLLARPVHGYISDIGVPGSVNTTIWVSCSTFGKPHVLRSQDGGRTWHDRSSSLPDIPVNAISVDPTDRSHIYSASDHGVYRSEDAGNSWADFSNGLPNVVVGDLIFHERLRLLRAGTRSRGIWEIAI